MKQPGEIRGPGVSRRIVQFLLVLAPRAFLGTILAILTKCLYEAPSAALHEAPSAAPHEAPPTAPHGDICGAITEIVARNPRQARAKAQNPARNAGDSLHPLFRRVGGGVGGISAQGRLSSKSVGPILADARGTADGAS